MSHRGRGLTCPIERPDTFSQTVVLSNSGLLVGGGPYIFSELLFEDGLVERQVGHDLLEFPILFAELAELADIGRAEVAEPLPPPIVGLLADPGLLAVRCPGTSSVG